MHVGNDAEKLLNCVCLSNGLRVVVSERVLCFHFSQLRVPTDYFMIGVLIMNYSIISGIAANSRFGGTLAERSVRFSYSHERPKISFNNFREQFTSIFFVAFQRAAGRVVNDEKAVACHVILKDEGFNIWEYDSSKYVNTEYSW